MAVILLDANIKYLLVTHRSANSNLLDIKALQSNIRMLAMEPGLSKNVGRASKQEYDVLTVSQSKLKLIIDELERVRFPETVVENN